MKKIVYLYGGPGTGKSTTAAHLFALAKQNDINAELVREYIKDWVWEGREIKPGDQIYIAAKQSRKERICFGKLDLIISDSPMYLAKYYEEKYDDTYSVCHHIIRKHHDVAAEAGYEFVHVFLNRKKKFNPAGRFQDEAQSIEVDRELKEMLDAEGVDYITVDADNAAAFNILKCLLHQQ